MSAAHLTDAEIDRLATGPYAELIRNAIRRQRHMEQQEIAAQQAEEAMSDAGKADDSNYRSLTLAVSGERAAGKTTLLMFLLDAMADAGLLRPDSTKALTEDPLRFLGMVRNSNEEHVECIDLDLDLGGVFAALMAREPEEERMTAKLEIDTLLLHILSPDQIKAHIMTAVDVMVDRSFAERGGFKPMTLVVDPL